MTCEQPIGPVLEHYGARKPRDGRGWTKIVCPFHDDTTASASVSTELNAFNCFACGVKGDTYSIIMIQEGATFSEAVKIAEGITGLGSTALRAVRKPRGGVSGTQGTISGRRSTGNAGLGRRATAGA